MSPRKSPARPPSPVRWSCSLLIALACLVSSPSPGRAAGPADGPSVTGAPSDTNGQNNTSDLSGPIAVLPQDFTLHGPAARQQLLVALQADEMLGANLTSDQVTLSSSDETVFRIVDETAIPVGDGQAELIARSADGVTATAMVKVVGMTEPAASSFRNDVMPILSRLGCNSGACHGALAGKGGFRLSLRGYDPAADHASIARQLRGRRIEIADPGQSLLLTKPTGALPHKGGLRLATDSREYQVLANWIATGAPAPTEQDARVRSIRVLPEQSLLLPGQAARVLVQAEYDDGRVIDVTHLAKYSATDEAVAGVDEHGRVTVRGAGEAAVLVWFDSRVLLSRMTVPFPHSIDPAIYATLPRNNFIDELNLTQLQTLQLLPSEPADRETFIRRATIDTIGRLPTAEETAAYLADDQPGARGRLIERLLASDSFVDYWTYKWSDLLLINGTKLRPVAVKSFHDWLRQAVKENQPWDQLVREILTSTGDSHEVGATNFFAIHQSPEEMTENASQAFLGLSIGCAKCHNHPLEKWTNDQYYAMANLFSRVRAKGWGGEPRNGDGLRTVYNDQTGELIQPGRGKPQPPAPLDADPIPFDAPGDRRQVAADWITNPENPYFARAITNRIWANFFGRGLVEQVDDLRLSNPATNEPLLAASSQYLIDKGFDLKELMRLILDSETYGRRSEARPENVAETKYHSRYYPRRLMAEVLLDAIDQVLETSSPFTTVAFPGADSQPTDFYPTGTRAIQLYDSAIDSYFLKTFGRNPREITCECERSGEPSMVQVLHMSNGETLNPKLADTNNRLTRWLAAGLSDAEIVEQLFLVALSRPPTADEAARLLAVIAEYGDDRRQAFEDACWSVLASGEFTFNH